MADGMLEVDTDALFRAAPPTQELSQRFLHVRSALEARLGELGQPWGDDEMGAAFYETYEAPKNTLLLGCQSSHEVLASMADGVLTMARGYTRLEDDNVEAVKSLTKSVRNPESASGGTAHPTQSGGHKA